MKVCLPVILTTPQRKAGYGNAATGLKPVAASLQPASSFIIACPLDELVSSRLLKEKQRAIITGGKNACRLYALLIKSAATPRKDICEEQSSSRLQRASLFARVKKRKP